MRRTGLAFTSIGGAEAERFRLLSFKGTKGERKAREGRREETDVCAHARKRRVHKSIMVVVGI